MSDRCGYELCRNWAGGGCGCAVLDMDPDLVEEDEP